MPHRASENTCEVRVGHLMEIRVLNGYRSVQDVDWVIDRMAALSLSLRGLEKYVIVADWRSVSVLSPEVAQRAREMLALSNPRVLRSSILILPERSITDLQVHRLVKEADNLNRRYFTNPRHQYHWLSEVLSPEESQRLWQFLKLEGEPPTGSPSSSAG